MTDHILTQKILKELLDYDPETGIFRWKRRDRKYFKSDGSYKTWNTRYSGHIAGFIAPYSGYRIIGIFDKSYRAHRLGILYMKGKFPEFDTDHINGVRSDNIWKNLREVSNAENLKNTKLRFDSKTGIPGVLWHSQSKRYLVRVTVDYKPHYLGSHTSFFEACCARKSAEIKYGFHENHGRR